mgnify:CR=1 FL=1
MKTDACLNAKLCIKIARYKSQVMAGRLYGDNAYASVCVGQAHDVDRTRSFERLKFFQK